jgi:hypothetical protein
MSGTRARSPTRYGWWLLALLLTISAACGGAEPAAEPTNVQPATVEVEVYFTNDTLGDPCTDVFGVTRTIDRDDILTGTLNALLAGPTPTEIDDGYGGWFGPTTADALLDATVDDDGTVHVTFTDLRELIPNASTSCGSTALLAMLDTTLLALDDITTTRYAIATTDTFTSWLRGPEPEPQPQPEPPAEPGEPTQPTDETYDPDTGWTRITDYSWPVAPNCCEVPITGPASPEGAIPTSGWPADGFYDVDVLRTAETPSTLRFTIRRWVRIDPPSHLPELTDVIAGDPASEVTRSIDIASLAVVLVPLHEWDSPPDTVTALLGRPGAFAAMLFAGIDPAVRTWVHEPLVAGASMQEVREELLRRSSDPSFPFGVDYATEEFASEQPIAYRGPLGSSLRADPAWMYGAQLAAPPSSGHPAELEWPPGDGIYDWNTTTLEIRTGQPILHVWAGEIAG